jgi:hypothetical protein
MNFTRIFLAALGAFVAYFVFGGLSFTFAALKNEFLKYPTVYRDQARQLKHMPIGIAAMFIGMVVLAVLYAMLYQGGSGLVAGARFGALVGLFAVCAFVIHNYVNLNIGGALTAISSIAFFIDWTASGLVIGLIYRPAR